MKSRKFLFCIVAFAVIAVGLPCMIFADHDERHEKSWYHKLFDRDDDNDHDDHHHNDRKSSEGHKKRYLKPVNNPTYREHCGACHFSYQPELLPSGSWKRILGQLDDHFGESLDLDPETRKVIGSYLETNAADHSVAKRAIKIMRSLGSNTPMRITEIPYIKEKHHEVPLSVLKRQSIGSLSNCTACHKRAEEGIYDDDFVVIPK